MKKPLKIIVLSLSLLLTSCQLGSLQNDFNRIDEYCVKEAVWSDGGNVTILRYLKFGVFEFGESYWFLLEDGSELIILSGSITLDYTCVV